MYGLYVCSSSLTCFCHFLRRSQEEDGGGGSSSGFNVVVVLKVESRVALHWRHIDKAMASSTSSRLASSSSSSVTAASRAATTAAASDDIYDFSGVANDLAILRSQLLTTLSIQASSGQPHHHQLKNSSTGSTGAHASAFMTTAMATCKTIKEAPDEAEDDEEWYPPSPPVYDVTEKLIEVNRELQEDPTSSQHFAGKLRWKPDDNLVQIKWLYSNDCDHSGFISDGTEEEVSSSDECDGGGNGNRGGGGLAAGLAAQLASELGARLCFTSSSSLYPPLPTIEDVTGADSGGCSQLGSVVSHAEIMADYDEDFEEPESLGHEDCIVSPMKDNDILTQISLSQPEAEEVSISSSSSESCRTVTTIRISRKDYSNSKETNNNIHDQQQRLQRPKMANNQPRHRTSSNDRALMSSSVSQTSELIKSSSSSSSLSNNPTKPRHHHQQRQRSSSLPKSHSIVSNSSSPYSYNNSSSERGNNQQQLQLRKMQKVNHATIQANNNNNSCSSSEEGSTSRPSTVSSSPRALPSLQHTSGTSVHHLPTTNTTTRPPPPPSNKQHQSACSGGGSNSSSSASVLAASSVSRKPPTAESRAKTKSSVYLNGNTPTSSSSNSTIPNSTGAIPPTHNSLRRPTTASGRLQSRRTSIPPLHRKTSRNSLSSNSSVSSQTTEDSLSSNGLLIRGCGGGRPLVHHRHPSVVADVMSPVDESPYFLQWKLRKREEKKLRARRSYLEQQMRRPY